MQSDDWNWDALEKELVMSRGDQTPLIRVVDDDEEVRRGIAFLLACEEIDYRTYESAEAYLKEKDEQRPGCLILDIRMPGMSGLQLQNRLAERSSDLPIIFLSGHGTLPIAVGALKKGAMDFLEKPFDPDQLLEAIQAAVAKDKAARQERSRLPELAETYRELSDREKQVLRDAAAGLPNKGIAEHFGISFRTVEVYRGSCFHKLGIRTTDEAARLLEILRLYGVLVR